MGHRRWSDKEFDWWSEWNAAFSSDSEEDQSSSSDSEDEF
jgi:hypothetical protein